MDTLNQVFHQNPSQTILNDLLIQASKENNLIEIANLLEKGANVDAKDAEGLTGLMWACRFSHIETVKLLIDKKANIEARDVNGITPLMYAAETNDATVTEFLLLKNADIEAKDHLNWTALTSACWKGKTENVVMLINHKANLETIDNDKWTPLTFACEYNHPSIVEILLQHKANIEVKDNNGWTPLMYASDQGFTDIVSLLLQYHADISVTNNRGKTAIKLAFDKQHKEVVYQLLYTMTHSEGFELVHNNTISAEDFIDFLNSYRENTKKLDCINKKLYILPNSIFHSLPIELIQHIFMFEGRLSFPKSTHHYVMNKIELKFDFLGNLLKNVQTKSQYLLQCNPSGDVSFEQEDAPVVLFSKQSKKKSCSDMMIEGFTSVKEGIFNLFSNKRKRDDDTEANEKNQGEYGNTKKKAKLN